MDFEQVAHSAIGEILSSIRDPSFRTIEREVLSVGPTG